jgi:hypothetical protein
MKFIKQANWFAGAAIAMLLGFAAMPAWCQSAETTTTTTTTTTVPGVPVNPNDPVQFPPGGPGPDSHEGNMKAAFVDQKIAEAKAQGQDTSAAETQEVMGQADLRKGMNDEAAQHFDAALRSVGVMPSAPGKDSGEAGSLHHPMP